MAWVRLDDRFPDHPKVAAAGPLAGWLYVCALAYANRMGTDGFIPVGIVSRLTDLDDAADQAARLVDAGLWETTDGGYRIHDYHDYQPTAEHREHVRRARQKAGLISAQQRVNTMSANAEQDDSRVPVPVPVPQVPTPNRGVGAPAEPDAEPAPVTTRRRGKATGRGRDWIVRDPLYAPLVALFGKPSNRECSGWAMHIGSLTEKEATPEEVPRRAANFPLVMPERNGRPCTMTLAGLDKYWHLCATVPATSQNGGIDAQLAKQREADRRRAQEHADAQAARARTILGDLIGPDGRVRPPAPKLDSS